MSTLTTNINPLRDGRYHIFSRNQTNGRTNFLVEFPGGDVGMSTETKLLWSLQYIPNRASYVLWRINTSNVLDATRNENANAVTWAHHGGNWQQWSIRRQIESTRPENDRVIGFTLTPLSQPASVLTMASAFVNRTPAVPAQLRPAPVNGGTIPNSQLWVFSFQEPVRRAFSEGEEAPVELQPGESDGELAVELGYCEDVQAQIAQAEEEIA